MIRLIGRTHDRASYELRDFLSRTVVTYEWLDVDGADGRTRSSVGADPLDDDRLPVCVLPGGLRVEAATVADVAGHLGWIQKPRLAEYDVSIYGAGPAGLSAAVYAASEGLSTVLLEREAVGGQAGTSSAIENFLGFPGGISGAVLAERARQQAVSFGAEILLLREGVKAHFAGERIHVQLADGGRMVARANICATGVEYRRLGLAGEEALLGRGLSYGAGAAEAPLCESEEVYIIGGGNSAGQAAMHIAAHAAHVTLLVRGHRPAASMSHYLLERLEAHPRIDIGTDVEVVALHGEERLEAISVRTGEGGKRELATSRLFVLAGGKPNTEWASETLILRDPAGYLITGADLLEERGFRGHWDRDRPPFYLETSVPGSFAVGDVRRGSVKRVASAVGEGAMAVQFVHRYLEETV